MLVILIMGDINTETLLLWWRYCQLVSDVELLHGGRCVFRGAPLWPAGRKMIHRFSWHAISSTIPIKVSFFFFFFHVTSQLWVIGIDFFHHSSVVVNTVFVHFLELALGFKKLCWYFFFLCLMVIKIKDDYSDSQFTPPLMSIRSNMKTYLSTLKQIENVHYTGQHIQMSWTRFSDWTSSRPLQPRCLLLWRGQPAPL